MGGIGAIIMAFKDASRGKHRQDRCIPLHFNSNHPNWHTRIVILSSVHNPPAAFLTASLLPSAPTLAHSPNGFSASCFLPPILSVPLFAVSPTAFVVSLMPEVAPVTVLPSPFPKAPTPSPTPLPTAPTVSPTVSVTPLVTLPRVLATPPRMSRY